MLEKRKMKRWRSGEMWIERTTHCSSPSPLHYPPVRRSLALPMRREHFSGRGDALRSDRKSAEVKSAYAP